MQVEVGEMPGKEILDVTKATFQKEPVLFHQFRQTMQTTGQQRDAYYAIFRK